MSRNNENNILVSGGVLDLEKYMTSSDFIIKGDTVINAVNLHNNMHLKIKLEKDASLILNVFDYAIDLEANIEIEAYDNSSFKINSSFISEEKYELNIDAKLYGDLVFGEVDVRGINESDSTVKVVMNGTVAGKTTGCVLNEYAHILNKSENSNVLIPNLVVNTNEVEANHGVSIGGIDEDEMFYLMSKGISKATAKKLIEDGFILSIMPDDIKERIKNILVGR